jgi:hypothetical protein
MPCLNSSGQVDSEPSSTPSARKPFQVNAIALVFLDARPHRSRGLHSVLDCGKPRATAGAITKRQKFISTRERWRARQQYVLNIVKLKHDISHQA